MAAIRMADADTLSVTRQYFHGAVNGLGGASERDIAEISDETRVKTGRMDRTSPFPSKMPMRVASAACGSAPFRFHVTPPVRWNVVCTPAPSQPSNPNIE